MLASWCTYYTKPGMREAFCRRVNETGLYAKCQADALRFEYLLPWDGSDRVLILERWTDRAQLQAHVESCHVSVDLKALKAGYIVANGCVGFQTEALDPIETD